MAVATEPCTFVRKSQSSAVTSFKPSFRDVTSLLAAG